MKVVRRFGRLMVLAGAVSLAGGLIPAGHVFATGEAAGSPGVGQGAELPGEVPFTKPGGETEMPPPRNETVPAVALEASSTYLGIPVGFTAEGHPYLGDPNAPVTLEEYSDFLCPFCGRYFNQTFPVIVDTYVRPGKLRYVFRNFPLDSLHPTASTGAIAALCVAEQGAVPFWKMHDSLFRRQREWAKLPDPSDFLADVASDAGADMAAYQACLSSGRQEGVVQQNLAAGQALRFNGTPSFQFISATGADTYTLVGALPLARFARLADPLIAGEKPPEAPKPPKPQLPFWAKPEGLAPDPNHTGFTVAGDAYKGNPKADLVVVEFTDLQCDSCRRHGLETQATIDRDFVETDKILWITKHFPLKMHPRAAIAAAAAECAGDQGQFFQMQHLLFEQQDDWTKDGVDVDAALTKVAEQLPLDMQAFDACFQGRGALERVLRDLYDAEGLIQETPTFVLLQGGKGGVTRGAKSASVFSALLNSRLQGKAEDKAAKDATAEVEGPASAGPGN